MKKFVRYMKKMLIISLVSTMVALPVVSEASQKKDIPSLGYQKIYKYDPEIEEAVHDALLNLKKEDIKDKEGVKDNVLNVTLRYPNKRPSTEGDIFLSYIQGTYLHSLYSKEYIYRYRLGENITDKIRYEAIMYDDVFTGDNNTVKHFRDLSKIVAGNGDDFSKVKRINKFIVENTEYKRTKGEDFYSKARLRSPKSILHERDGVCQTYAAAFQIMAEEAGIESVYVTGYVDSGYHAWNVVRIDGKMYGVDTTWNATGKDPEGYLLVPIEEFEKDRPSKGMLPIFFERAKKINIHTMKLHD